VWALLSTLAPNARAITINLTYFNEGDPVPHDENPAWDPDGTYLKAHFQAAKAIWEYLLPGGGEYDLEFEWDNDIDGLGLFTPVANFIEISPDANWFVDTTPGTNEEFSITSTSQKFYNQLSPSDQSTYFPATAPPGVLETRYALNGNIGLSGPGGYNAQDGFDLLTVILHELGHALGVTDLVGEYDMLSQHVGGGGDVEVRGIVNEGGSHLAGNATTPGFLMCNACEMIGLRRLPSATDVLVIAEDQSITDVRLARVGRISSGIWSDANAWIGGAVPSYQDVYISHGGTVTLDEYAVVRSLNIFSGANSLQAQNNFLNVDGPLTFTGATVSVGSGGTIMAASIVGDPSALTTTAGSLVLFNQLTAPPSTTSVTFNGSIGIGIDPGFQDAIRPSITFDRGSISTWNIAEGLSIGNAFAIATVTFNNGAHVTSSSGAIGSDSAGEGHVIIDGLGSLWTTSGVLEARNGSLELRNAAALTTGAATLGSVLGQMQVTVNYAVWEVNGNLDIGPATYFDAGRGTLAVQDAAQVHVDGNVTIRGTQSLTSEAVVESNAFLVADGDIFVKSYGVLRYRNDREARERIENEGAAVNGGVGGLVIFEDTSDARESEIHNRGAASSTGAGGQTSFTDSASADNAAIHNHGATNLLGQGGATFFYNNSTAGAANITNHADGSNHVNTFGYQARTIFRDSSNAGSATIENEGAPSQSQRPGLTEFHNNSSAANATINNRGFVTPGGTAADLAGRTAFYDSASAAFANIRTYEGTSDHGRVEFFNQSSAGSSHISIENETVPGGLSNGGYVYFYDNSTADQSFITLRAGTNGVGGLRFNNNATAANAQIISENLGGNIAFFGSSTAANAYVQLGRSSVNSFYDTSTAANATFSVAGGAQLQFQNQSSVGSAQIVADGSPLFGVLGGRVLFNTGSLINSSTIVANGGIASNAPGATVEFNNGSHAGNSTIIANGGANGGGGATISIINSYGDTAQIIANAGSTVDIFIQPTFNSGNISLGSIEGAGKFLLRGAHLTTGSRNTNTTVSGPIVDNPPGSATGGRLTKVGTGTLTLAGTNTYSGLTTVDAGTLSVTGSIAGGAIVNNGGTLGGSGTIAGNVTVNSGGVFAPGTSPGIITIGSLTMNAGSTLQMELGGITPGSGYDRIQSSGALAFDGALQVSLIDGFTPSAGQSFDLFNWGSTSGTFSSLTLPSLAGLAWNTSQLYTDGVLSLDAAALSGDFNEDGAVNAADYVAWRKGLVASSPENYDLWRTHFGQSSGGGSGAKFASTSAPEPSTVVMLLVGAIATASRRRVQRRIRL
jgi:autotransporter-associated beta strand protein/T5SS/PEP-CTERM-associated repeat protein